MWVAVYLLDDQAEGSARRSSSSAAFLSSVDRDVTSERPIGEREYVSLRGYILSSSGGRRADRRCPCCLTIAPVREISRSTEKYQAFSKFLGESVREIGVYPHLLDEREATAFVAHSDDAFC